jgi:fluoride exporter
MIRNQNRGGGGEERGRFPLRALLLIAIGGALGAPARHGVAVVIPVEDGRFPWATLLVNLAGCLTLGALLTYLIEHHPPTHTARLLLCVGFLGAFTTFSTFAVEVDRLWSDGFIGTAVVYVGATVGGGVGLTAMAVRTVRRLELTGIGR